MGDFDHDQDMVVIGEVLVGKFFDVHQIDSRSVPLCLLGLWSQAGKTHRRKSPGSASWLRSSVASHVALR